MFTSKKMALSILALAVAASLSFSSAAKADDFWGNQNESYNKSGASFSRGEALKSGDVIDAIVLSVRPVLIEATGTAKALGTGAGAAIGGVAGSSIGKGKGKIVTGILGAVLGGAVGVEIGETVSEIRAGEIILQLADLRKIFVVQADGLQFKKGQSVFLIVSGQDSVWQNGKSYRVAPIE